MADNNQECWASLLDWCEDKPERLAWLIWDLRRKAIGEVLDRIEALVAKNPNGVKLAIRQERDRFSITKE